MTKYMNSVYEGNCRACFYFRLEKHIINFNVVNQGSLKKGKSWLNNVLV